MGAFKAFDVLANETIRNIGLYVGMTTFSCDENVHIGGYFRLRLTFSVDFFVNTRTHHLLEGRLGEETRAWRTVLMNQAWTHRFIETYKSHQPACCALALAKTDGTLAWRGLHLDLTVPFMAFMLSVTNNADMTIALEDRALVAYNRSNENPFRYARQYLTEHDAITAGEEEEDTDSETTVENLDAFEAWGNEGLPN